ncbi:MAG TPA: hypothetical protein VFW84_04045 [Aquabacterium sp.]|uniref:hypothetical protein n=1 Tax=Aquabacterium sp. TaxID=1872578 RepID=UPI002E2FBA25|nr:hypothetical protein [Aquabacterium sp.]HEX5371882.1 hypothetical protein [Aquabacterium sp.]
MTAATSPEQAELMRLPRHPSPRRAIWVILALFTLALLWACLGQVDMVAVASGRIVASEGSKQIPPPETSMVKAIHVQNGGKVNAGQLLIELDPTTARADNSRVAQGRVAALPEVWRTQALLGLLDNGKAPSLPKGAGDIDDDLRQLAQLQLDSEWLNIRAQRAKLEADFETLFKQGFLTQHADQDCTQLCIKAGLTLTEQMRQAWMADTAKTFNECHARADLQQRQLVEEGAKAGLLERLTCLAAPVSGAVQQRAVHTTGDAATTKQVLLILVPEQALVTASDVMLENKVVGFVGHGQKAEIKLATKRYESVSGRVM